MNHVEALQEIIQLQMEKIAKLERELALEKCKPQFTVPIYSSTQYGGNGIIGAQNWQQYQQQQDICGQNLQLVQESQRNRG